jgi:hypothetical protein
MDPTTIVIGSQSSARQAGSALPDAPVIERPIESRRARPKRAAATFLRRLADRIETGEVVGFRVS